MYQINHIKTVVKIVYPSAQLWISVGCGVPLSELFSSELLVLAGTDGNSNRPRSVVLPQDARNNDLYPEE